MRLLIVEDDPILQRSLAASMREEGYAVDTASDGEEGLFKAGQTAYDGIVLDVMLPKLDGWEFLQRLRPDDTTPILMLTALDSPPDRVKGLDRGADDYLPKPFDLDELLARIRALIRRSKGRSHSTLTFGDVSLDTASRSVFRNAEPISLTAREYSLFEYLALHQGKVITRSELYEHLFDDEEDSLSNLLDVHVSNLRKKLDRNLIVTRRGHGYLIP